MKYFNFFLLIILFSQYAMNESSQITKNLAILKDEKLNISVISIILTGIISIALKLGFPQKNFSKNKIFFMGLALGTALIGTGISCLFFINNNKRFEKLIENENFDIKEFSTINSKQKTIARYINLKKQENTINELSKTQKENILLALFISALENFNKNQKLNYYQNILTVEDKPMKELIEIISFIQEQKSEKKIFNKEKEIFAALINNDNYQENRCSLLQKEVEFLEKNLSKINLNQSELIDNKMYLLQLKLDIADLVPSNRERSNYLTQSLEIINDILKYNLKNKIDVLQKKEKLLEEKINYLISAKNKNDEIIILIESLADCLSQQAKLNKIKEEQLLLHAIDWLNQAIKLNYNNIDILLKLLTHKKSFLEKIQGQGNQKKFIEEEINFLRYLKIQENSLKQNKEFNEKILSNLEKTLITIKEENTNNK